MKKEYINYLGRMKDIESSISDDNNKILQDYIRFCSLSAGKEKQEQRKRFALQFLDLAEKPFKDFNREVIQDIYLLIKNSDREISGKNEAIKNLKYFIRWLKDDENLLKGLKAIHQRKGYNTKKLNPSTLLTEDEIKALLNACKSEPKKVVMISLQTELGLRPSELLALKWKDIKIDESEGVGEVKIYSGKTRDTRVLPFKDSINVLLLWKEYYPFPNLKDNDLIFPNPLIRNKPLYRSYLSQLYRNLSRKLGMRNIYPYLARHSKLTKMNGKLPSKVAAAYGGHSEKIASVYTHLSEDDIREIVLKQIYDIKEPDTKTKKKLEEDIEKLKLGFSEIVKYLLKKGKIKIRDLEELGNQIYSEYNQKYNQK
jgi:integrase